MYPNKKSSIAVATALMVAWPLSAPAQDWFKSGSKLLGDMLGQQSESALDTDQISKGLREALRVGSESVVSRLGSTDGFNGDPDVHIPLPRKVAQARELLSRVGLGSQLDDLELQLNRAAEVAVPRAKSLFVDAIANMSLDDARGILNGPDDAATRYFKRTMGPALMDEMAPVVDQALADVGAIRSWEELTADVAKLPFMPNVRDDLRSHVLDGANDGVFHYLAKEEAAIRADPAARTTELLRTVFGQR